jgi:hypothetical protein
MEDVTPEALDALQERLRRIEWGVTGEPCAAGNVDETAALEADTAITALRAQLATAHSERDAAIAAMSQAARKRGEAEGKLAASETAGVVEGWRDRALKAEAALATARADAVRETASVARQHIYYDSAGTGFQEDAFDNAVLALIATPSAPSPEAVARAALDGFPSDDDREWIDARADELFRSSERQRGGIRPATITPRDFRDFFVVNATAERIAAIITKAEGGE